MAGATRVPLCAEAMARLQGSPCWICDEPATCYLHERLPFRFCDSCDGEIVAGFLGLRPSVLKDYMRSKDAADRHWSGLLLQVIDDRLGYHTHPN